MTTYENAPSTKMLATHCACCARPLRDAVSVETGVGPDCRKKHGYNEAQGEADFGKALALVTDLPNAMTAIAAGDAHKAANVIVYHIAAKQDGEQVARWTTAIAALGYTTMASIIAERIGVINVQTEGNVLLVKAPFSETFNAKVAALRGQYWDKVRKVRVIPVAHKRELWNIMKAAFQPGTIVRGSGYAVL